jgi:glutamate synthase domain-containing protein 3
MMMTTPKGPVEGYQKVTPTVARAGDTATIDAHGVYYRQLNEAVRAAFADGAKTVRIKGVNGQRYIGNAISGSDLRIEIDGVPGGDMSMFMNGPTVVTSGNAQDGVANTMNSGTVYVNGDAGDVLGYGMRGGRVFVKGDVGYRVGIHMKAYEDLVPVICCGGNARAFFGEYMAGGILVLLGRNGQFADQPLVGPFCGSGMHGGVIYLRGEVEAHEVGKECGIFATDDEDMKVLRPIVEEWCAAFGDDADDVLSQPFTKLVPVSHRPYVKLYAPL